MREEKSTKAGWRDGRGREISTLLNAWALSVTMNDTVSFFQVMHTHTLMYSTHTHALTSSHIHYTPAVAVTGTTWAL